MNTVSVFDMSLDQGADAGLTAEEEEEGEGKEKGKKESRRRKKRRRRSRRRRRRKYIIARERKLSIVIYKTNRENTRRQFDPFT